MILVQRGPSMHARVLFSEGSSLTAREFVSVLGPAGHHIEVLDPNLACICRFSRWVRRVHRCPASGTDPLGYLDKVNAVLANGAFDVLLPTHEQAWLFAAARTRLDPAAHVAVASPEAFSRVQSKIEFARLLDETGLPQPQWRIVESAEELAHWEPPFYLKAPFSTAGAGVLRVADTGQAQKAFSALRSRVGNSPLMVQAAARGEYAQVQALFDHGRLVAAHESIQTAAGIGPSAAGRVSVRHPFARREVGDLGKRLAWHGGLTLDYIFRDRQHFYIECNPRTVEPANAAASGVDLPSLQLEISLGRHPDEAPAGKAGVRTHSSLATLLGTAAYRGTRTAVFAEALQLALHQGPYRHSRERLTPFLRDVQSMVPLAFVCARVLFDPGSARRIAGSAVTAYSVTPGAIERAAAGSPAASPFAALSGHP
jgi:hypothetical protein